MDVILFVQWEDTHSLLGQLRDWHGVYSAAITSCFYDLRTADMLFPQAPT